jgi:putative heme-binding domain-containing protein
MRLFLFLSLLIAAPLYANDGSQDEVFYGALMRLDIDLDASPGIKAKVDGILERNRGSDMYMDLVSRFKIKSEAPELFKIAVAKPNDAAGVKAARLLLGFGEGKQFTDGLGKEAKQSAAILSVLGYTNDDRAGKVLENVVLNADTPKQYRTAAVKALASNRGGERRLLGLISSGKLPQELQSAAAGVLFTSSDSGIRDEAARHLKLPQASGGALPPVNELVKMTGDPGRGKALYATSSCMGCHKVGDVGLDFGPNLSEIGDKLPPEALFTAILDPSDGISMGYEGFIVDLHDGSQAVGYIGSETDKELVLRMPGGIAMSYKKEQVKGRKMMKQSLMPPNLQLAMTAQQLVDLVAYLSSLKK